ncbi:ribosome biogenesis protein SLX9 homolog [Ochlerotatus camptorhynchus]|uniref:ribosome biogenesis protein SLX9 homolog n=1 Tax=Ochlerotatus camptorhynchus TaxID=644619 RepID=UPI0031D320BB
MGKLNKKLVSLKPHPKKEKKEDDSKVVSGPFPIYRSTPVQLNGPEPKNFKLPSKSKTKLAAKSIPVSEPESPKESNDDPKTPGKTKKLRKIVISRLNKKDKVKFRKEEVLKRIELTQKAFKEDKQKKKREKTAVTGDMKPLLDALPSLDSLFKLKSADAIKTGVPKYDKKAAPKTKQQLNVERLKKKRVEFLARCQKINQVLKSKKFKKNPKKMIAEHIRNTRKEQLQLLLGNS